MKKDFSHLEAARIKSGEYASDPGSFFGAFGFKSSKGKMVLCIAHNGVDAPEAEGWEHVSVSVRRGYGSNENVMPDWETMCYIKRQFWDDDETVIQFHPKQEEYVNIHDKVLHLWKKAGKDHPLPPGNLV